VYVPTNFFLQKLLTQLIDHAVAGPYSGLLDGTYLGLGQQPTGTLNPTQGLSAITEATYDGYARLPLTWHGPYQPQIGQATLQADGSFFAPTGSVVTNQITSMFVADALAAGNLLFSEVLPGGVIPMIGVTSGFGLAVLFQLAFGNNYGDVVVIR
jgi:hypothetical protein